MPPRTPYKLAIDRIQTTPTHGLTALPTARIDAITHRRHDQLLKAAHHLEAWVILKQSKWRGGHRHRMIRFFTPPHAAPAGFRQCCASAVHAPQPASRSAANPPGPALGSNPASSLPLRYPAARHTLESGDQKVTALKSAARSDACAAASHKDCRQRP